LNQLAIALVDGGINKKLKNINENPLKISNKLEKTNNYVSDIGIVPLAF